MIDGDNFQGAQEVITPIKSLLCVHQLFNISGLQNRRETTLENLDPRDNGNHNCAFATNALRYALMAVHEERKRIGVEECHSASSVIGRPRRRYASRTISCK